MEAGPDQIAAKPSLLPTASPGRVMITLLWMMMMMILVMMMMMMNDDDHHHPDILPSHLHQAESVTMFAATG